MKGVVAIVVLALAGVCSGYYSALPVTNGVDLFPEGIVYDRTADVFYLSSLSEDHISIVSPTTGMVVSTFTDEELTGFSTLGLAIDENSTPRSLLVAGIHRGVFANIFTGSPLPPVTSMLFSFSLTTKTLQWSASLTGAGEQNFANDIAIDEDGTAYVTDSRMSQIWVVSDGNATVYLKDETNFGFLPTDFVGINGIKIVRTGDTKKLIVNKSGGKLYQVSLSETPTATEIPITLAGASSNIVGATDGLEVFSSDGSVEIVTVGDTLAVSLYSMDDWATAVIDDKQVLSSGVSTVANYDGDPAVIHGFGMAYLGGMEGVTPFIEFVRIDTDPQSEPTLYELVSGIYYNDGECVEDVTCCCHVGPITIQGPMPYQVNGKYPVLAFGEVSGDGCFGSTIGGYNLTFDDGSSYLLNGSVSLTIGPVQVTAALVLKFDTYYHGAVLTNNLSPTCINSWTDVPTTCWDETKNGDEAGVDCGGSCAAECPTNTCTDDEKNGDEDGVDCGGSCPDECPSAYAAATGVYVPDGDCEPGPQCCCYTGEVRADGHMYPDTLFVTAGLDGGAGCGGLLVAAYNMTFESATVASFAGEFPFGGGSIPFTIEMEFAEDYESASISNSLLTSCSNELTRNAPTCEDGLMNGDETDVDDGGSCNAIDSVTEATGTWVSDGTCSPGPTCCCYTDAITYNNGSGFLFAAGYVTGEACGGLTYGSYNLSFGEDPYQAQVRVEIFGLGVTLKLTFDEEFDSAVLSNSFLPACVNNIVRGVPTCADGAMNHGETEVDCGGPCDACPTCEDGVMNQDEEDIDCGGAICDECPTEASGSVLSVSVAALLAAAVAALFKA